MTYEDHIAAVAQAMAEENDARIVAHQAAEAQARAERSRREAEKALKEFNYEQIGEHMSAGVA